MRAAAAAVVLLLAGCLQPGADVPLAPAAEPADAANPAPADPGRARAAPSGDASPERRDVEWPDLASAKIRPGVQVLSATGQCTSNFVFTSPDAARVYLGLAAHCVDGMAVGDGVDVGGVGAGTLAYSSWITMEETGENDTAAREYNDFALILLDEASAAVTHPAVRHFGGPVALATSGDVGAGEKVLTYGNSGLRAEVEPASWHEGWVVERPDPWTTTVLTATPGVPGDSGSAVLTGDGRALGVLVTLTIAPLAGTNGVTSLDLALAYAAERGGVEAHLATWDLLQGGLLPAA